MKGIRDVALGFVLAFSLISEMPALAWRSEILFDSEVLDGPVHLKEAEIITDCKGNLQMHFRCTDFFSKFSSRKYSLWLGDEMVWSSKSTLKKDFSICLHNCELWNSDTPNVYTLRISKGQQFPVSIPVAFCDIYEKNGKIFVNGEVVNPLSLVAMDDLDMPSLETAKLGGFNTILRKNPTKKDIDLCMKVGLYLFDMNENPSITASHASLKEICSLSDADILEFQYVNRQFISVFDAKKGVIEIHNNSLYPHLSLKVEIQQGEKILDVYEFGISELRKIYRFNLPPASLSSDNQATYLNLEFAYNNRKVYCEQIPVSQYFRHRSSKGGLVRIDDMNGHYVYSGNLPVSNRPWVVSINKQCGYVDSYVIDGKELIADPIRPMDWSMTDAVSTELMISGSVVVSSHKGFIVYSLSGDGTVDVIITDSNTFNWQGTMRGGMTNTECFCRGPQDSEAAGYHFGKIGRYAQPAGWTHSDAKWFSIQDDEGVGIVFESDFDFIAKTTVSDNGTNFMFKNSFDNNFFYFYPSCQ